MNAYVVFLNDLVLGVCATKDAAQEMLDTATATLNAQQPEYTGHSTLQRAITHGENSR